MCAHARVCIHACIHAYMHVCEFLHLFSTRPASSLMLSSLQILWLLTATHQVIQLQLYIMFSMFYIVFDLHIFPTDHVSLNTTAAHQMAGCYANEKALQELLGASSVVKTKVFPCLSQVVQYLQSVSTHPLPEHCSSLCTTHSNPHPVAVLVTGSLHLVGATMRTLGMAISDV